ncbi:MAG: hypothetical protein KBT40_02230 [bacterium]|nr:hypothetical protein [Candidatus Minthenecus merdequi]
MISLRRFGRLISSREVAIFFGFFLLSCFIWVMYTIGTQREITMVAPVVYYGVPDDVKMDDDLPSEIEFTISDEGSQVWRYAFAKPDTIEIDLTDKFRSSNRKQIKINFENYVRTIAYKISQTCEIVAIDPPSYQSEYLKVFTKRVPVILSAQPITENEFSLVGMPVIRPSEVRIRGSRSAVEAVQCVYLDTIREHLTEDKTIRARVVKISDVEILDCNIVVDFKVERLTEKEFTLPITLKNVPEGVSLRLFPKEVDVVFKVGLSQYQQLNATDVNAIFDFNTILEGTNSNVIRLESSFPLENINYKIIPERVDFLIENK